MDVQPKPEYHFEEEGPFLRAYLKVYGRSRLEAMETGRTTRSRLATDLSSECSCRPPVYKGFDEQVRRHFAEVVVVVGGDRTDARKRLARFVDQLSSDR